MERFASTCLIAAGLLAGCATRPASTSTAPERARERSAVQVETLSPIQDFNLERDELPAVLVAAVNDTYAAPEVRGCAALAAEIRELDAVLGADFDLGKPSDKNEDFVARTLIGAIRGLIPYRSVLRMVTGANRRERRIAAAVAAGSIRRGYLKGLGEAQHCKAPAAPARAAD